MKVMGLERVERLNLGLSAGAVAASYALATPHFTASLAVGAMLEAVNFGSLHRGAKHFFAGEIAGAGPWLGLFAMRFVLLAGGIIVVMSLGAHPVALVIGLSIAMPAALIDAWLHRPEILPPDPAAVLDPDDPAWDRYSVWQVGEPAADDEGEADEAGDSLLEPVLGSERPAQMRAQSHVQSHEHDEEDR